MKEAIRKENPEMVLIASPNNPTGNSLTSEELDQILSFISPETVVVIDEAYASFANKDTSYIKPLLEKLRTSRITFGFRFHGNCINPLFEL